MKKNNRIHGIELLENSRGVCCKIKNKGDPWSDVHIKIPMDSSNSLGMIINKLFFGRQFKRSKNNRDQRVQ